MKGLGVATLTVFGDSNSRVPVDFLNPTVIAPTLNESISATFFSSKDCGATNERSNVEPDIQPAAGRHKLVVQATHWKDLQPTHWYAFIYSICDVISDNCYHQVKPANSKLIIACLDTMRLTHP